MNAGAVDDAKTGPLWSALPVPALVVAPDGTIKAVNPAAEAFLSTPAHNATGRVIGQMIGAPPDFPDMLTRAADGQTPLVLNDLALHTGGGTPMQCDIRIAPLDRSGRDLLALIEPRTIAERLGHAMQARSAARSAVGMAQMLAHEIKNPLAGITGAAQLLAMNAGAEDVELTSLIVEECQRILALIGQVETFGDQRPPGQDAVNIHDVLERARMSAAMGFAAHMRITDAYDPSLPPVAGDADQLLQVMLNLMKNAAEACADGGTITLRTFYQTRMSLRGPDGARRAIPIHVEIADTGPGIPPDIRDSLFEPFVSARENGTGLGLALVSKIIAAHGGAVEVDSKPGETVMRVSLPVARADPAQPPTDALTTKEPA